MGNLIYVCNKKFIWSNISTSITYVYLLLSMNLCLFLHNRHRLYFREYNMWPDQVE